MNRFDPSARRPPSPPQAAHLVVLDDSRLLVDLSLARPVLPRYADLVFVLPADEPLHHLGSLDGEPVYAVRLTSPDTLPAPWSWAELRRLMTVLTPAGFSVAGRAAQLLEWARNHRFCGRCGQPTTRDPAGERALLCSACGFGAYPRINPCVIGIVTRGDEILLARAHRFTNGMFSALAGFMEVGETAEETLIREVREEVGLEIANIRYFGSQPWPFPSNLMLGFRADYAGGELVLQDDEIAEAAFFRADALPLVPPHGSIARALIDDFLNEHRSHD